MLDEDPTQMSELVRIGSFYNHTLYIDNKSKVYFETESQWLSRIMPVISQCLVEAVECELWKFENFSEATAQKYRLATFDGEYTAFAGWTYSWPQLIRWARMCDYTVEAMTVYSNAKVGKALYTIHKEDDK